MSFNGNPHGRLLDARLQLDPIGDKLVGRADAFAREYLQHGARSVSSIVGYRALLKKACEAGLATLEIPQPFGGAGSTFATRVRVCEVLAKYHAGFAFSFVNHYNIILQLSRSASPAVQTRWIPIMLAGEKIGCTAMTEPQSGSDFTALHTMARRQGDGWLLTGSKAWITNAVHADVLVVYAQTNASAGSSGIAAFLVEASAPGFIRDPPYQAFGTDGTGVGGFVLHDCFVKSDHLLCAPGQGFMAAMRSVNCARVYVAAMNAAMIARALDIACQYAEARSSFGKPLPSFQGIGWSLATVATRLQALYLLVDRAIFSIETNKGVQMYAAMAKKYANEITGPAIAACMQIMGAEGLTAKHGLGDLLAWARAFCYTDGTPEMMNERIAYLMRKPYRSGRMVVR